MSLISKALPPITTTASGLGIVFLLRQQTLPIFWRITQVHLPLQESVATRLTVLGKHLVNLVSPLQPTFSDAVSIVGMGNPMAITVAGALCAVIVFAIRRRLSVSAYALLLMIAICLLPALSILPLIRFYSPHYAYIAVAPVAGIALLLIRSVRKGGFPRRCIIYACLLWGIAATLSTAMAGTRFKSDLTFFAPEVRRDPRFLEAWFYLGNYYGNNNIPDQAWKAYDAALTAHPGVLAFSDKPEILINQSSVAFRGNGLDAADSLLRMAQTCAPPSLLPFIADNRAIIAGRRGDWDSVIAFLAGKEECLRRPEPCLLLAEALRNRGREREAKEMERRSLESGATARFPYSQAR